ncbi:MAG: recombination-associated protein RdgC [Desulfobia sp.]
MGIISSSFTFVRYSVEGELPDNFWDFAAKCITSCSFRDIDDTLDERSLGWVSVHNMFDTDPQYEDYAVGDYIVLSLRIDERKIPTKLLKKYCLKEEVRLKKKKELAKLSKSQKMEIKENVHWQLLKQIPPQAATYDICWNLAESVLYFFSTTEKVQSELENFFKETFGLSLQLQIPYLTAEHLLEPDKHYELARLSPQIFI